MYNIIYKLNEIEKRANEYEVFSFDVFDTLIFRSVEGNNYREFVISERMSDLLKQTGILTDVFEICELRRAMFNRTKQVTGDEVDYYAAIAGMLRHLNVPGTKIAELAKTLYDAEKAYELKVTYANPEAEPLFEALKRQGKRIIAICDMYLPKDAVEDILRHAGLYKYLDALFVSSECDFMSKASGSLYDYVGEKYIQDKSAVLHTGDNYVSDFENAVKHNFHSYHYVNKSNEKRKERVFKEPKRLVSQ